MGMTIVIDNRTKYHVGTKGDEFVASNYTGSGVRDFALPSFTLSPGGVVRAVSPIRSRDVQHHVYPDGKVGTSLVVVESMNYRNARVVGKDWVTVTQVLMAKAGLLYIGKTNNI